VEVNTVMNKSKQGFGIKVLSAIVSRALLAAKMGTQYDGDRDLYQALGYPTTITYAASLSKYLRQAIAKAVIDRPVDDSWQGGCLIQEDTGKETELSKAWASLIKNHNLGLFSTLTKLDKFAGIGTYGTMLLGFDDVSCSEDFRNPVEMASSRKLLYCNALGEDCAVIASYDTDPLSERYGLPTMYDVRTSSGEERNNTSISVHHTRMFHIAGDSLGNRVRGRSRLEPVWNNLMDLEKVVGGSGEMFWRGARPGYSGKIDDEYSMSEPDREDFKDQLDEYEHNLRRFLITKGVEISSLSQQLADPKSYVDVQIEMISAETGIPKRILTGSEVGELASSQDASNWNGRLSNRRTHYIEPVILRPFIEMLMVCGVLPATKVQIKDFAIVWQSLDEKSDKDKAEVGEIRARSLKDYAGNPLGESIVPPEAFYRFFLGFNDDEIKVITSLQEAYVADEERDIQDGELDEEDDESKKGEEDDPKGDDEDAE